MPRKTDTPGVYKRAGSSFWQLRWTDHNGRETRRSSGTENYEAACKQLEQFKLGKGLSFSEAALRFFAEHTMQKATRKLYLTCARQWVPIVGGMQMDQIGQLQLRQFVSSRLRKVSNTTIRSELSFMSSLFRFAMQLPEGPEVNPVISFDKRHLKMPEVRVKWLEPHQVKRLLEASPNNLYRLMTLFGLEAGLRKTEILSLRVHQLDLINHNIVLQGAQTKTKRPRRIPMSATLLRAVCAHRLGHPDDWVFPNKVTGDRYRQIDFWWVKATQEAGLNDFHFHDTRHHFATWFVKQGGRLQAVSKLLGHKTIQMTERYAFLAQQDAEDEFRRLEAIETPTSALAVPHHTSGPAE